MALELVQEKITGEKLGDSENIQLFTMKRSKEKGVIMASKGGMAS